MKRAAILLLLVLSFMPALPLAAAWAGQPAPAAAGGAPVPAGQAGHEALPQGETAHGAPHLDGAALELYWIIPFLGILLSIAIMPLAAPRFWHANFGKISALWAFAFLVPFALRFGFDVALFELLHTMLLEYVPFIILLFALFTISGGVRLRGTLKPSPINNTGLLAVGMGLASLMGTTGAAMLMIRPVIQANIWRRHSVHVVVFFIFLVANIGGSLTPLGDPPLFLGFLKGVDFFWPTVHMLLPMLLVGGFLLAAFYALDSYLFLQEGPYPGADEPREPFGIQGAFNLVLILGVVGSVLLSGLWRPDASFEVYHVEIKVQNLVRDLLLLLLAFISLKATSEEDRRANAFTWFPIVEVAKLFAGIFLTIIPAIAILRAGEEGVLAPLINTLSTDGQPVNALYFWITGVLSSFLDNAPTYLVFFNTAGGDPQRLMGPLSNTLLAVSAGAVFMGAMTYIGNAPNFMVRSIAEERGIPMPSFFGYLAWSCGLLLPIFAVVTVLFFM